MATIGRSRAVAVIGRVHLSGWPAWMAWLLVHVLWLIGFRNRLVVLIDWAWAYLTFERSARLILDEPRRLRADGGQSKSSGPAERQPPTAAAP